MKRIRKGLLVLAVVMMAVTVSVTAVAAGHQTVEGKVDEVQKYGNLTMDINPSEFYDAGFELGDMLKVTVGDKEIEMPFVTDYSDVDTNNLLVRHDKDADIIVVAINMGDFAKEYDVEAGDKLTFTMKEKEGYLSGYLLHQLDRTNKRSDYTLDSVYANFRSIATTGINPGVVYRGSSPINNELNRAKYADDLSEAVGIETVINLSDSKEKAEESDRLKSSFLANLSHEIRTPMNGIFGFAELLREKNIDEDEKAEYIDVIKESGKRMMNIIEDLVNISSIESGQMQVSKEKTNVNEVLEYLHQSFELKIEQRNVKLRMHVKSSAQPLYINTDKEKLHIIINNLLKNAFRFTEQGTIDFGYHLDNEKNNIEFYVKDTGRGIAPEQQQAIFKRFVQVDTSLSRDHEGAGLGLSIAKAYVEILGGKIWVESEKEKGSVFYFTIPLENEDQDKLTSGKQGNKFKSINKDATILVCDDDEVSLKYFEDMFAGESINLLIARNGKEAIELYKHHQNIQLVFMDTKMPVIDGVTAAQYIKESNPQMPVIALPAFALESEKRKFGDMFDSYITKPVEKDLVMETINKFLSAE